MTGVINDIEYTNTEGPRTAWHINDTCHAVLVPFSVGVSYVINDTCHAVVILSVLVYPMSLMTLVMLS
jgi:hypothetical protein